MSQGAQWLRISRRRNTQQQTKYGHDSSGLSQQSLRWDADDLKPFDIHKSRNYLAIRNVFSMGNRDCNSCWCVMDVTKSKWLAAITVCMAGVALSMVVWLSGGSSLAGLKWPWSKAFPAAEAANFLLIILAGLALAIFTPAWRGAAGRPLLPTRARAVIFYVWLLLNAYWFVAGIRERDFQKKPKWLRHPSARQSLSDSTTYLLRLSYGIGMAAAWPLLANLFVVLLPVDRTLLLLSCAGVGHEEGVLAHALCGTAVWGWASAHALLTQLPMLAAGLWRPIMLPPRDGSEAKGISNFMGLMAWLLLCAVGVSSLAPVRRAAFNTFMRLHLLLAPAVLLLGCLHDSKVFWYSLLGAVLYAADVVQRFVLRRRTAVATATVYPLLLPPPSSASASAAFSSSSLITSPLPTWKPNCAAAAAAVVDAIATAAAAEALRGPLAAAEAAAPLPAEVAAAATSAAAAAAARVLVLGESEGEGSGGGGRGGGGRGGGGDGGSFVVLRIATGGPPGCVAGQHVFIKVPAVSRWEWHPYSVAAHDCRSFALVVKAGGDWEQRLCGLVANLARKQAEEAAEEEGAPCCSCSQQQRRRQRAGAAGGVAHLEVQYEGMYGTPDLQAAAAEADRILLFAGGAGITPIASVLQSLLQLHPPHQFDQPQQPQWLQPEQQQQPIANGYHSNGNHTNGVTATPHAAQCPQGGGGGCHAVNGVGGDPWVRDNSQTAISASSAAAAAAASVDAGAAGGSARVHLVWAVTQETDAQPLLPLLRAAVSRGWAVDLHCTRQPHPAAQLPTPQQLAAVICHHSIDVAAAAASTGALTPSSGCAGVCNAAAAGGGGAKGVDGGVGAPSALLSTAACGFCMRRSFKSGDEALAAAAAAPPPPWQLRTAACWGVAALAAVGGAVGRALGSGVMSVQHCDVVAGAATVTAATAAAAGGDGAGATAAAAEAWVASVRQAFAAAALGGGGGSGAAAELTAGGGFVSLLRGLLSGGSGCPTTLDPTRLIAEAAGGAALPGGPAGGGTGGGVRAAIAKAAGAVSLRVCRVYGMSHPELCVKCDPFKSRSPLERMWPCCSAPVCYYGSRLAPLLGWLLGVAVAAALACFAWRLWRQRAVSCREGAGGCRRQLLLAPRGSGGRGRRKGRGVGSSWLTELRRDKVMGRLGRRGGHRREEEEALLPRVDEDSVGEAAAAAEEGVAGEVCGCHGAREEGGVGLEAMLADLGLSCGSCSKGPAGGAGGVRVHVGRPDVDAYIKQAAMGGGSTLGGGKPVYGVVVCGPESLQSAVQSSFGRYVEGAYPGSWFRGFSFTT